MTFVIVDEKLAIFVQAELEFPLML